LNVIRVIGSAKEHCTTAMKRIKIDFIIRAVYYHPVGRRG
jgi:hypothetical protein